MATKEKNYVFKWKGEEFSSFSESFSKALSLPSKEAKEFAQGFMEGYRNMTEYADNNVGYFIGYYDGAERSKLQKLFKVVHPIFGKQ